MTSNGMLSAGSRRRCTARCFEGVAGIRGMVAAMRRNASRPKSSMSTNTASTSLPLCSNLMASGAENAVVTANPLAVSDRTLLMVGLQS